METNEALKNVEDPNRMKRVVERAIENTDLITKYLSEEIIPLLPKNINRDKKSALVLTYNRNFLFINTLRTLKNTIHFQTAASIARSMFELHLDLNDLTGSDSAYEKFFAWGQLEINRLARNMVEFNLRFPNTKIEPADGYLKMFNESTGKVEELVKIHWDGNKKVKHWSGNNFRDRVNSQDASIQRIHAQMYKMFSWHVHAGYPAAASTNQGNQNEITYLSHDISQVIILASTLVMDVTFGFQKIKPDFLEKIEKLNEIKNSGIKEEFFNG